MPVKTLPNLLLAESSQSWGDERERAVMLEGYAYVYILTQFTLWTVGAVIAWFVPAWVTVVLFLAFLIPALEWQRFTRARGVDANTLAYSGAGFLHTAVTSAYIGACALSMAISVIVACSPDAGSTSAGAIAGGVGGIAIAVVAGRWAAKRKAARADDAPDEL
ncbi:MAG: hypothetical protein QM658_12920 [Gordonia sp. (in: high G+C Gram-positive bacteria)]